MATTHISSTCKAESRGGSGEGFFVATAIAGAIGGALVSIALVGPAFGEMARFLAAPVGVVFGSLGGGMVGRLFRRA